MMSCKCKKTYYENHENTSKEFNVKFMHIKKIKLVFDKISSNKYPEEPTHL